jgi:hypothetical protein
MLAAHAADRHASNRIRTMSDKLTINLTDAQIEGSAAHAAAIFEMVRYAAYGAGAVDCDDAHHIEIILGVWAHLTGELRNYMTVEALREVIAHDERAKPD